MCRGRRALLPPLAPFGVLAGCGVGCDSRAMVLGQEADAGVTSELSRTLQLLCLSDLGGPSALPGSLPQPVPALLPT